MEQNFKNHARLVPMYHYVTFLILAAVLGGAIVNAVHTCKSGEGYYSAALVLLLTIAVVFIGWYSRTFALKAQDRAIRAEENFRHYILTGKPLPSGLRLPQIIALRFASDEEFPGLVKRALDEKLGNKAIKQEIKNWRGDHDRV